MTVCAAHCKPGHLRLAKTLGGNIVHFAYETAKSKIFRSAHHLREK